MSEALAKTRIGPGHHGRRMSLTEFAEAEGQPGYLYELARGVIEVVDLPDLPHADIIDQVRQQLAIYRSTHPHTIRLMGGGGEAGMQLHGLQSERHPDLSVYLVPPPDALQPWDQWVPDIAIEVVSPSSRMRDYRDKRDEYLTAGVREYWVVDPDRRVMVVLRRAGDVWRELQVADDATYQTPLLPGFTLQLAAVFAPGEAHN